MRSTHYLNCVLPGTANDSAIEEAHAIVFVACILACHERGGSARRAMLRAEGST